MREFAQLDSQNFYVCQTVNYDWTGAIDIEKPKFDKETEKAKYISETHSWEIKTIEEWEEIRLAELEEMRIESEKQAKIQEELDKADHVINQYNFLKEMGVKFEWE